MDVDLLRPGTVPLSPDTILWFEFLLDPTLLKKHLSKQSPEPSACELIVEFLSVNNKGPNSKPASERVVDVDAPASPAPLSCPSSPEQFTRKQLALKILALKVAATLRWNLDTFENKLPPIVQQQLMQDLLYMATDGAHSHPPEDIRKELIQQPCVQFAMILYHRWNIRFPVNMSLNSKTNKMPFTLPGQQVENGYSQTSSDVERVLRSTDTSREQSLSFLEEMLIFYESTHPPERVDGRKIRVPSIDTFKHLTEDSDDISHNWTISDVYISTYEIAMQIHYDLCYNYFFYGHYDMAKKHILGCRGHCNKLEREVSINGYNTYKSLPWGNLKYASVIKNDIHGYIRALNLGLEVLREEPSLLQKLQEAVSNKYADVLPILQADNIAREIPLVQRQIVELDIQGATSAGTLTVAKDLLNKVIALNAVRYALEGGLPTTHPDFVNKFKTVGIKFYDLLFWALGPVLDSKLSDKDWENLRLFFLHLVTSPCRFPIERIDEYLKKYTIGGVNNLRQKLISDKHMNRIMSDPNNADDENIELPKELLTDDWEVPGFDYRKEPDLEMGRLKKRLIEASTADDVRMCLVKLAMMAPTTPLWKMSPSWKPAGGLASALIALPRGFLQDFGYVVTGTARSRAETGFARVAMSLMSVLEGEARSQLGGGSDPFMYRLCRLLSWELLLLQVNVMLSEWPHHRLNLSGLTSKCKACIAVVNSNDNCIPRPQVVEACWVCLMNACEWEGASGGATSGVGEAAAAMCAACYELQRGKASRKFPRQLWDYALAAYGSSSSSSKRSDRQSHSRDPPNPATDLRYQFNLFLTTLREPLAVTVACSLLSRIYNILVDEPSLDLTVEYLSLWPVTISNMNNYNPKLILESLSDLLERSLKLYPYNTSWLRLYGDVEACCGRWGAAMRRYICGLAAGSWYFAKRAPDEASVARRMVRCCQALGAPTQAAALCQLPDDTDYTSAFKCLAEKSVTAADAMDAYYVCMWDSTLLEVAVASHARRGEAGRRARAVRAAGALDLNANNSDDILREAAAARRGRLLRALADHYAT